MILIVSSTSRERVALTTLCESRGWPCVGCDSVRALRRRLPSIRPAAVVTRHRLADGYSDDVIALLATSSPTPPPKVVVLLGAAATAAQEARQIALGADSTHRDPVRADVLIEYIAKYRRQVRHSTAKTPRPRSRSPDHFCGATIDRTGRRMTGASQSVALTPRELQLIELLTESRGAIVTYDTLYAEILDRRFDGDSGNLRVLLAQLVRRASTIGLALRDWIDVIPKAGYRLRAAPRPTSHTVASGLPVASDAVRDGTA